MTPYDTLSSRRVFLCDSGSVAVEVPREIE